MTDFVTSDSHLGHWTSEERNIITYCSRPFSTIEEMDAELIKRWNEVVRPRDRVYCLGDFTLADCKTAYEFINQLNGYIFLVPGGHDYWLKDHTKLPMTVEQFEFLKPGKLTVLPPIYNLRFQKQTIVLSHYPLRTWRKSHYGSVHLHGHSHGNLPPLKNSLDCGVDSHDFAPIKLEDAIEMAKGAP